MKGIDLLKFIFSLVVVWIHTGVGDLGGITHIAVPFFYIVSGFFLFGKLFNEPLASKEFAIITWLKRILRLYLIWTLIFLPFAFWGFYQEQTPLFKAFAIYFRNIIFVGENYLSWPLWYLLGMLWSGIIIWLFYKIHSPFWCICMVAIILFFGKQYFIQGTIADYYYSVFKTTRNGLFVGFPFMTLGGLIRRFLRPIKPWSRGSWQHKTALVFRYLSIHIYLSHMIWAGLIILVWGVERGFTFWAITSIISIITGFLIRPCDRLVNLLYGRTYHP